MKRAFTLIEVNLAMLIMAGGILSIVGLYSFGFRENSQSRADVASAALSDSVMSPLIMAISSTNLTWSTFRGSYTYPTKGWESYMDGNYQISSDPESTAEGAFSAVMGRMSGVNDVDTSFPSSARSGSGLSCALVVHHEEGSAIVSIAFRAVPKNKIGSLMSQPLYYTEVRFQGREN